MKGKRGEKELQQRIQSGELKQQDIVRRLAELAFGRANDCVKLVLDSQADLENLDLSLLSEVKRSEKGTVEVKLIDRLRVLEQLTAMAGKDENGLDALLSALQEGENS